jgi:hypothetical protein
MQAGTTVDEPEQYRGGLLLPQQHTERDGNRVSIAAGNATGRDCMQLTEFILDLHNNVRQARSKRRQKTHPLNSIAPKKLYTSGKVRPTKMDSTEKKSIICRDLRGGGHTKPAGRVFRSSSTQISASHTLEEVSRGPGSALDKKPLMNGVRAPTHMYRLARMKLKSILDWNANAVSARKAVPVIPAA